jgi:hypothetical protein
VAFGADRYLVAWTDYRSGFADILGQRLTQAGALMGGEIGLSPAFDDHEDPVLAFGTQQDQWLVVWRDFRNGNADITGQFVTREGLLSGEPIEICAHGTHQYEPAVAYNSDDDEFLVVWQDSRSGNLDIYGQRVDAGSGNLVNGVISITADPDSQLYPALAYNDGDGQYLVVWVDKRDDPGDESNWNIYGLRLNPDGTTFDVSDFVICARQENQSDVAVAYNPVRGQYLVVWLDHSLPDGGIAGQRVRATDPRIAGFNFDICAENTLQRHPSLASGSASGEYLVAWQDNRDGATDMNIYGRRVSGTGALLGTADIPISTAVGNQWRPHVSYDSATDRYNLFWIDERNSAPNPDIYGQALAADGQLLFTDADENVPAWVYPGGQTDPAVAIDPADGRGLLVWEDNRNGQSPKIYGRLGEPADLYQVFLPLATRND